MSVAHVAKVHPRVSRLMNEERSGHADIAQVAVLIDGPRPGIPRTCRDGMRWRAYGQKVHGHEFGIGVPPRSEKSRFGLIAVIERVSAIEHPLPIGAFVDFSGQLPDAR